MVTLRITIPGGHADCLPGWFEPTQRRLYDSWVCTTRHDGSATGGTWACEIASRCRTCNEHLSVPCSLLAEANEIGKFLGATCYSNDPGIFFRLYLILLDEFCAQLEEVGKQA